MTIECPICDTRSAASQKRLREIARLGIARLLTVAHKAGVELTTEQQRQIFEVILEWDPAGLPGAVDWLVHEHMDRGAHYAVLGLYVDERLADVAESMPSWSANAGCNDDVVWDCKAERKIAEQLASLWDGAAGAPLEERT